MGPSYLKMGDRVCDLHGEQFSFEADESLSTVLTFFLLCILLSIWSFLLLLAIWDGVPSISQKSACSLGTRSMKVYYLFFDEAKVYCLILVKKFIFFSWVLRIKWKCLLFPTDRYRLFTATELDYCAMLKCLLHKRPLFELT